MNILTLSEVPTFPPPAFVQKVLSLGFGTGPWTRKDFDARWGRSSANRFVDDGKKAGWLLSPYQNSFYVPGAQDLALMPWLPPPVRAELAIARGLAMAGLRFWCLSAWLSDAGLESGGPLFVIDLRGPAGEAPPARPRRGLPFPEALAVVPKMPPLRGPGITRSVQLPRGEPQRVPPSALALDVLAPEAAERGRKEAARLAERTLGADDARTLRFVVSLSVSDPAWALALATSLGIPRIEERLPELWRQAAEADTRRQLRKGMRRGNMGSLKQRALKWMGTFVQPAPNSAWSVGVGESARSYLFVPDALWREVAAGAFARRYQDIERLGASR